MNLKVVLFKHLIIYGPHGSEPLSGDKQVPPQTHTTSIITKEEDL